MGKLIDTDKLKDIIEYCILANVPADAENTMEEKWNDWFQTVIDKVQPVEAISKAEYEARVKADMVAMLTEIQLEIEEKAIRKQGIDSGFEYDYEFISSEEVKEVIQQKIDKLKGEEDGNNN